MPLIFSSTTKEDIERKAVRDSRNVVILVCFVTLIAIVLLSWLGFGPLCPIVDGTTYRAGIKVKDEWGSVRNPEISFGDGWYHWVTGGDQILAGPYKCVFGNIATQEGWTFQLYAGGALLTVNGMGYTKVFP
jgi:hypothetical protein